MPLDNHARKPTTRHRFRDVSNMKLSDIFHLWRRRRLRREVSRRSSSLSHSQSCPFTGRASPVQPPSSDLFVSSSIRYRSSAVSILSATEEGCSSGMSTPGVGSDGTLPGADRASSLSPRRVPAFPTSPSIFQLRSASTEDYLVDRLEQHLRRLSLGDASPDQITAPEDLPLHDIPMEECPDTSLLRITDLETSSRRAFCDADAQKSLSSYHDDNVIPMILITSVDAKHSKPLPPSPQRSSRTPFSSSNIVNHLTNVHPAKSNTKALHDDPFTTQPHGSTHPADYNLSFGFPSFTPPAYPTSLGCDPETPTPMYCNHFGDCRGDLWEVLHPPLVAGTFTLPPFKFPPLSTDLFDDAPVPLPY